MFDVEIHLRDEPGQLALMGESLGRAGISVEGGGMWVHDGVGVAHFLVADGQAARAVLAQAGLVVTGCREVLVQRLRQDVPGQLGALCRAMADADINIEVLYSDHEHQLILAVDDHDAGRAVSEAWAAAG